MKKSMIIGASALIAAGILVPTAASTMASTTTQVAAPAAERQAPAAEHQAPAFWLEGVKFTVTNQTGHDITVDGQKLSSGDTSQQKEASGQWDRNQVAFDVALQNGKSGWVKAVNPSGTRAFFECSVGGQTTGEMPVSPKHTIHTTSDALGGKITISSQRGDDCRIMNLTLEQR